MAAEREKAASLSRRTGIGTKDALRVVRGQVTLNEVLEEMFLRQRIRRLTEQGIRVDLAGQVVRGRLALDRARRSQALWDFQQAGWKRQKWKEWSTGTAMGLFCHGREPFEARLLGLSRYELVLEGSEGVQRIPKDQVIGYCLAEDLQAARTGFAPEEGSADLGPSRSLADRWRPTVGLALEWARLHRPIRFRLRNGQVLEGWVRRVAFFEIEVEVHGVRVLLMTHALRKDRPFEVG